MKTSVIRRKIALRVHKLLYGGMYTIHGVSVSLPENAVEPELKYAIIKGRYENPEAEAIRIYLTSNTNVIELGGSLGVISRVVRDQIGPSSKHLVVEANPGLIDVCRINAVGKEHSQNSVVINAAVAYGCDEVRFVPGHNAHVGRVATENTDTDGKSIRAVTLRSLLRELPADQPWSLVSDIEGGEWDMLENETDIFGTMAYAIIETHPRVFADRRKDLDDFVKMAAKRGLKLVNARSDVLTFQGPAAR